MTVWVDGVAVGHPGALVARADIQALVPGYANTDHAVTIDRGALAGTGVSAVHVWAYPITSTGYGAPHFVGVAQYGDRRPDVGAYFGQRFAPSAFAIVVDSLLPGTYDLAVFPYSAVAGELPGLGWSG